MAVSLPPLFIYLSHSHLLNSLTFSSPQLIISPFHLPLTPSLLELPTSSSPQLIAPLISYLNLVVGFFLVSLYFLWFYCCLSFKGAFFLLWFLYFLLLYSPRSFKLYVIVNKIVYGHKYVCSLVWKHYMSLEVFLTTASAVGHNVILTCKLWFWVKSFPIFLIKKHVKTNSNSLVFAQLCYKTMACSRRLDFKTIDDSSHISCLANHCIMDFLESKILVINSLAIIGNDVHATE